MKVALCLYGQPRDAHIKSNDIIKNVILPNQCDVFFHAWYDSADLRLNKMTPGHESRILSQNVDQFLLDIYSPKKFILEPQRQFFHKNFEMTEDCVAAAYPWSSKYDRDSFVKDRARCTHSMWYSVMMSLTQKELYSQEKNFTYDCVILSRFDVAPTSKVEVKDYNLKKLITRNHPYPRGEISDWFMFSCNDNMNAIASNFQFLNSHYQKIANSKNTIWTNEAFLREQTAMCGIQNELGDFNVTF